MPDGGEQTRSTTVHMECTRPPQKGEALYTLIRTAVQPWGPRATSAEKKRQEGEETRRDTSTWEGALMIPGVTWEPGRSEGGALSTASVLWCLSQEVSYQFKEWKKLIFLKVDLAQPPLPPQRPGGNTWNGSRCSQSQVGGLQFKDKIWKGSLFILFKILFVFKFALKTRKAKTL